MPGAGRKNAKSLKKIAEYLQDEGKSAAPNDLNVRVIRPLKKSGLVGSCSEGYFYISAIEDLKYSYETHLHKVRDMNSTLKIYEKRAAAFGISDLKGELNSGFNDPECPIYSLAAANRNSQ